MPHYRHLSDETFIVLFTVGLVSSLLSILGSSLIIWNILRRRKHVTSLFHRIMLGLSTADCFCTTAVILQPFLVPVETDLLFAMGNKTTCSAVGVLMMTMVTSYVYSCALSMYFLLIVRQDGAKLSRSPRWEPWLHVTPWLLTLVLALLGIFFDAFTPSPVLGACWLGCTYTDTRDDCLPNTAVYAYRPFTIVAFGSFLTGIVCTCMVFLHVRWKIQRNNLHVFCPPHASASVAEFARPQRRRSSYMVFRHSNGSSGSNDNNSNNKNLATVAQQALCYTAAFANSFLVNLLGLIVAFWEVKDDGTVDRPYLVVTVFLVYTLYPMQGWIHFLIYSRPAVARWCEAYPQCSYVWALGQVMAGRSVDDVPASTSRLDAAAATAAIRHKMNLRHHSTRPNIIVLPEFESKTSKVEEDDDEDDDDMIDLALESVELPVPTATAEILTDSRSDDGTHSSSCIDSDDGIPDNTS